ncbi:7540_t:CDS:1, partial [Rhizophagus irregularis]
LVRPTAQHDKRVKANQRLHHEIEDLKMQVQETEKIFNIPEIEF